VLGSPHFVCNDTDVFCPSLDITKDPRRGVSIVKDASCLTAFLELCFAHPEPPMKRPSEGATHRDRYPYGYMVC